jgi:hypothetical protein
MWRVPLTADLERRERNLINRHRRYARYGQNEWALYAERQLRNLREHGVEHRPGDHVPAGYRAVPPPANHPRIQAPAPPAPGPHRGGNLVPMEVLINALRPPNHPDFGIPHPPLPDAWFGPAPPRPAPPPPPAFKMPEHHAKAFFKMAEKCGEVPDCPVCLEPVTEATIAITPCGHIFCGECLATTMAGNRWEGGQRCPTCRATP